MDENIKNILEKYKYHKYECLKVSNAEDEYETFKLSLQEQHPDGYSYDPCKCKVHFKDKYLICVEFNGDIHKWSLPDFKLIGTHKGTTIN